MNNFDLLRQIESAVLSCVSSDHQRRQQAYTFVEDIKSNPTQSISIGFDFFTKNQSFDPLAKHFGLQCIEETIKYKWTSLDSQLKISIKERLWLLMSEQDQLPTHLKTILVRCVCEIAKREWPQQWPSFLDELVSLTKLSATNDYSLLILAYLIEDVIVLQTLNSARKRDIQTTLLQHGNKLLEFIEYFLELSNTISSSLYALTMFATFLPIELFFSTKIIDKIVLLLNSSIHRMKAAEFLSVISDRRGKYEERLPLLQLFSYLFQTGSQYNDLFSSIQAKQSNETYDFMKQYAMVITALCDQLCYLCGGDDVNKRAPLPEQFSNGTFLQVLLALMQHPSIYISLYGYQMWLQILKANIFQENDYKNISPVVLRALCHSLVKQPYKKTDQEQDIASYYIHYDFEDECDYQKFVGKNRTVLIRSIDNVCKTHDQLSIAIRIGFDYADYCFQSTNLSNLLLFESLIAYWQIIERHVRQLLTSREVFNQSKILSDTDQLSFCQRGQTLIEQLLSINNHENLEFLAYSLRLLTCLYVFTRGEQSWTQRILEHLFRVLTAERQLGSKVSPLQKQASCLIDLCLNYGHSLFIYFNDLFQVTQNLVRQQTATVEQQNRLAGWQWSSLVESLAILLNHFQSYQQQVLYINGLVEPFAEILTKFNTNVNDLQSFIDYIGLKSAPDAISTNNHRLILLSVHILCGLLRRIVLPTDSSICANGGYQETFEGTVFIRNPAAPSFLPLTNCVFKLLTYCHALHSPSSPLAQTSFSFLSTMTDAEKAVYLQQENNEDYNGSLATTTTTMNSVNLSDNDRRLHNRFSSFLDRLQLLIGTYFTLKPDLYQLNDCLNTIGTTLFSSLDHIPDFRLRNMMRNCFLPFVRHCPVNTILIAVFEPLLPFMYTKLKDKWKIITERQTFKVTNGNTNGNNDEDHQTQERCEEEVIEEQVTCYLTRDFIDILRSLLTRQLNNNSNMNSLTNGYDIDETSMDDTMTADEQNTGDNPSRKVLSTARNQQIPSEFGLKILQESSRICQYCLLILFDGLSWPDTSSITKMSHICQALIKHLSILINGNNEFLRQLYIYILCALKIHGDNEPIVCILLSLAVLMYETFQQTSSNLFDSVLMEIPDVTNEQVNNYRDKMQKQFNGKSLNDKQKRDMLKHLVQPLMGQNVAQMFKREPLALSDLPPLIRFSKRALHPVLQHLKQSNGDYDNDDHGLASLFQHTDE